VDIQGRPVDFQTGEIVFGEPGTNGQHSFYQLIHQGTEKVPCDFIGFIKEQYSDAARSGVSHHEELMTNFFAQPDALAFGRTAEEVRAKEKNEALVSPKVFPGNRPSTVFLLKEQDPFSSGVLLALLEHRAAVKGFVWGINSFDQFGVELGKVLGVGMRERIMAYKADQSDPKVLDGLNPSTAATFIMFLDGSI